MQIEHVLYDTETIVHHRFQFDVRTDEDVDRCRECAMVKSSGPRMAEQHEFHQVALDKAL